MKNGEGQNIMLQNILVILNSYNTVSEWMSFDYFFTQNMQGVLIFCPPKKKKPPTPKEKEKKKGGKGGGGDIS